MRMIRLHQPGMSDLERQLSHTLMVEYQWDDHTVNLVVDPQGMDFTDWKGPILEFDASDAPAIGVAVLWAWVRSCWQRLKWAWVPR